MNTHQKLERLLAQQKRARDSLKEAEIARASRSGSKLRIQAIHSTLTDIKNRIEEVRGELQVEAILRKEANRVKRKEKKEAAKQFKQDIGYTEAPPDSCATCIHFRPEVSHKGEHYNPMCGLYSLKVKPSGYCNSYSLNPK